MSNKNKQANIKKLNYLKAVIIVHGKSELRMCNFIKSNLRIKMEFISNKNGESSIQISGLLKRLNGKDIKDFDSFYKEKEDDIEIVNKKLSNNFRIFIIMDTDDCSEEEKNNYKNKTMFKKHWAYDYICPIYNDGNLEEVLKKAGIINPKNKSTKQIKKDYIKIFPTDRNKKDTIQIKEFYEKLLRVKNISNMHKFIKFCLDNKMEF